MNSRQLTPTDWCFIEKDKNNCPNDEKNWMLEYEYSREAVTCGLGHRSETTWRMIFGDQFPKTAFLSMDPVQRRKLLEDSFKGTTNSLPWVDITKPRRGLHYQVQYDLRQEYMDHLEALHDDLSERDAEDNLGQPRASIGLIIDQARQKLPPEAYDQSVAQVKVTIDFAFSDEQLLDSFAKMLKRIRRTDPAPTKKNKPDARLKQLATARLYNVFGTVAKASLHLEKQGFARPYADDSGWTRARNAVQRILTSPDHLVESADKQVA